MEHLNIQLLEDEWLSLSDKFRLLLTEEDVYIHKQNDGTLITLYRIKSEAVERYILDVMQFLNAISPSLKEDFFQDELNRIDLSDLYIMGRLELYEIVFPLSVELSNTIFQREVDFKHTVFQREVDFTNTIFNRSVTFEKAIFNGIANFSNAIFEESNFQNTVINERITFNKAKFQDIANFQNMILNNEGSFRDAVFELPVRFKGAIFKDTINFHNTVFNSWVSFQNVIFHSADFYNATFKNTTFFSLCIFNSPPRFHKTTLHQDTSFEGAKFNLCETERDYRAYRTLKQHMNNVHAKLEENMFFALEQKTRQYIDIKEFKSDWINKLHLLPNIIISFFYYEISDYGQNTIKPLLWLFFFWFVFGLGVYSLPDMIAVNEEYFKNGANWVNQYSKGFGYALQNAVNPLSIFAKDIPFYAKNNIAITFGHTQALFSLAFIALWLLAVRRRFQKGD